MDLHLLPGGVVYSSLTNALHTVHDDVQLLARPQLGDEDVTVNWSDAGVCKHVCLVPNRDPLDVSGINFLGRRRGEEQKIHLMRREQCLAVTQPPC